MLPVSGLTGGRFVSNDLGDHRLNWDAAGDPTGMEMRRLVAACRRTSPSRKASMSLGVFTACPAMRRKERTKELLTRCGVRDLRRRTISPKMTAAIDNDQTDDGSGTAFTSSNPIVKPSSKSNVIHCEGAFKGIIDWVTVISPVPSVVTPGASVMSWLKFVPSGESSTDTFNELPTTQPAEA